MLVELQTCCSALGYQEGDVYHKEPDCGETVKDLIRFLKREEETCDIRRQLGNAQILQNDLIPIIRQFPDDAVLWDTVIRLMVNLTQPAVLCFHNHVPEDKITRHLFLEVEGHLQSYKEAFVDEALFAGLTKKLGDLLQLDWERRQEEDRMLIERILILVRNVLHVPPNTGKEQRTEDDASIHDQVLWALHVSGLEDLLLYLASSEDERQFSFHVLEIISLMFREQTPEQLASAGGPRSISEREKDEQELAMARETEKAQKKAQMLKYSSRHSRFGGTYVIANMKSISDRDVIYHSSISSAKDVTFDKPKKLRKTPKNRAPIKTEEVTRRSTLSIRIFLKEFCVQFLENCYNPLMYAVKDTLSRAKAQENDETYYMWAMRFFMEFQRKSNFRVDTIGETLSFQIFHYIQTQLITYHEMLLSNKKEAVIWSKRMHMALRAYYELLQTLFEMGKSQDETLKKNADVIKGNVFYVMEYRDIFVTLLKTFDESRQSRAYLRDLIESTHIFMKMLEQFCGKNKHVVVQRKKKVVRKQKKKQKPQQPAEVTLSQEQLDDVWDEVSGELSTIFQGRGEPLPENVSPFDAASEVDVDQQRAETMGRIQDSLRSNKPADAVALFRAAREVWPERDEFGQANMSAEDEFMALREVFYADLSRTLTQNTEEENEEEETEEILEEEDELHEANIYDNQETEFNFRDFVLRFAQPMILRAYVTLLKDYRKNSVLTNHCIMKMLHRIAFDCAMVGMVYQMSLFRIFQRLMDDPAANTKQFKELLTFGTHVLRRFFEHVEKNPKLFMEVYFWKSTKEAYEVTEGYGTLMPKEKGKILWTEEQDEELRTLNEQWHHADEEERADRDVVTYILDHLIDSSKTRRQVLRQMISLNLIDHDEGKLLSRAPKKPTISKRAWREEEELELKQLFEDHQEAYDILGNIIDAMQTKRSRAKITEKLMEMGLVTDKAELYKKRKKGGDGTKSKSRKKKSHDESDDEDEAYWNPESSAAPSQPQEEDLPTWSSDSDDDGFESVSDASSGNDEPVQHAPIKKLAKKYREEGSEGCLEWLKNAINQIAQDREEDNDFEPVPLVPLMEDQEDAMENKTFQNLLKKIGVKPPADEQERFWRVPGSIRPAELRSKANALTPPPEGTEASGDDAGDGTGENEKKKKDKSKLNALKALVKERRKQQNEQNKENIEGGKRRRSTKRVPPSTPLDDISVPDEESLPSQPDPTPTQSSTRSSPERDSSKPSSPVKSAHKSRLKRTLASDSDSDDDAPLMDSKVDSSSEKPAKKARIIDDDDSEDEMEKSPEKRSVEPQSFPATMMSVPLGSDSDSDMDDHIPLRRHAKKATIESDSDDE